MQDPHVGTLGAHPCTPKQRGLDARPACRHAWNTPLPIQAKRIRLKTRKLASLLDVGNVSTPLHLSFSSACRGSGQMLFHAGRNSFGGLLHAAQLR
eukprot:1160422-Pelagomonas_calceolata.AAC.8